MRNLDQNASAITGFGVAPTGASVGQIEENLDTFTDNVVAFLSADTCHKAYAAGVVLMGRVVETLGRGQAGYVVSTRHRGLRLGLSAASSWFCAGQTFASF